MDTLVIKLDTTEAMAKVRELRQEMEAMPAPGVMLLINPATCTMEELVKVAQAAGVKPLPRRKTDCGQCKEIFAMSGEETPCDGCPDVPNN